MISHSNSLHITYILIDSCNAFYYGKQHTQKNTYICMYISRFYSYSEVQNNDLSDLHRSSFRLLTHCS